MLLQEVHMTLKTQCLIYLIALAVADVLMPIPIVGIILIYVVLQKPPWFHNMVSELYKG